MINELKKELINLSDENYKNFSSSLLPDIDNIIGIRLPILRKKAKEIIKSGLYKNFLKENDDEFFELTMLEGMIISTVKVDFETHIKLIKKFIKKINNWSICDSFSSGLKILKKYPDKTKIFLEKYFNSKKEFELRFAYVILTYFYKEFEYEYIIDKIKKFNNEAYYAKMACAWCFSYCLINDFEKTVLNINNLKLHPFVFKKGITKAIESYRLNSSQKEHLKRLRKVK